MRGFIGFLRAAFVLKNGHVLILALAILGGASWVKYKSTKHGDASQGNVRIAESKEKLKEALDAQARVPGLTMKFLEEVAAEGVSRESALQNVQDKMDDLQDAVRKLR